MFLVHEAEQLLTQAGYSCQFKAGNESLLYFEDECLLGAVASFDTVSTLISEWAKVQSDFLHANSAQLRRATEKAWNCYTLLLSPETPSPEHAVALAAIEEDFVATRKVARGGILTATDLQRAIMTLLPLQATPVMDERLTPDLASRLSDLPDEVVQMILGDGSAQDIADAIVGLE